MMGDAVEQCRCHFCVAEDGGPFAKGEVRRDDDRGALIEAADQVEQQLTTGLCKRQIAELVEE